MTPSAAGFGRRSAGRTRRNTKREVIAALDPLRQVTVAAWRRPAARTCAQAESLSGAVAGQRARAEPDVARLVGFGRFSVGGHLALDLQRVGQAPGPEGRAGSRRPPRSRHPRPAPRAAVRQPRHDSGHEAVSEGAWTPTPVWQLPILPRVPECCIATPGEEYPSLGKPVSSTTHTRGRTTATARRAGPARTAPTAQVEDVMNCCNC